MIIQHNMHAMNANTFTGAAFHLTDAKTAETFAASLKDSITSTQWMCGIPDKTVLFVIDNNIIAAFFQELLSFLRRTLIGELIYDEFFL